jgi:hypothetical protein
LGCRIRLINSRIGWVELSDGCDMNPIIEQTDKKVPDPVGSGVKTSHFVSRVPFLARVEQFKIWLQR